MDIRMEYVPGQALRKVVAYDADEAVGELAWMVPSGTVIGFFVNTVNQGKGVATTMWEYANSEAVPEPERPRRPTEEEGRTESGEALYWKARGRREAREAGETPPSALKE